MKKIKKLKKTIENVESSRQNAVITNNKKMEIKISDVQNSLVEKDKNEEKLTSKVNELSNSLKEKIRNDTDLEKKLSILSISFAEKMKISEKTENNAMKTQTNEQISLTKLKGHL